MRFITSAVLMLCMLAHPSSAQQLFTAAPTSAQLEASEILVVDIRTPEEWIETGVLPDALLLTFDNPVQFLSQLEPHLQPGQPVALICRTGSRTARAAQLIAAELDQPVIDLAGGMFRLMRSGYSPQPPTRAQGCNLC